MKLNRWTSNSSRVDALSTRIVTGWSTPLSMLSSSLSAGTSTSNEPVLDSPTSRVSETDAGVTLQLSETVVSMMMFSTRLPLLMME